MTCRYLTLEDRKSLERLYDQGAGLSDIATSLGVHLATIYRELTRGDTGEIDKNGREGYNAELAQKALQESLKRRGRRQTATT
nr:MAG TPA: RNaseH [Caudoviricetes sp.]